MSSEATETGFPHDDNGFFSQSLIVIYLSLLEQHTWVFLAFINKISYPSDKVGQVWGLHAPKISWPQVAHKIYVKGKNRVI